MYSNKIVGFIPFETEADGVITKHECVVEVVVDPVNETATTVMTIDGEVVE